MGFAVRNLEGVLLGSCSHFVEAPAGAVMVVKDGGRARALGAGEPPHLRRVDLGGAQIVVDWPAELEASMKIEVVTLFPALIAGRCVRGRSAARSSADC